MSSIKFEHLRDKQRIALARAAEALGMDSERYRFKQRPRALLSGGYLGE